MADVQRETSTPAGRKPTVLIVDDEAPLLDMFEMVLRPHARVLKATSAATALQAAARGRVDAAFLDVGLGEGMDGIALLERLKAEHPQLEAIICSVNRDIPTVVRAMKAGAFDYMTKGFAELQQAPLLLARALERQRERRELTVLRSEAARDDNELVGTSTPPMSAILDLIARAAPTRSTVLLLGESGTGKELLARRVHRLSERTGAPFVAVNVAAIPRDLVESILFGHHKGAFTGATEARLGKFELADGGTLFLDEIGDLELALQAKVLRALQERQVDPIGAREPVDVDVRLVAATHFDLAARVARGEFRDDLFYRLNVVPIQLPPLRERVADLPELIALFVQRHAAAARRRPFSFSPEALAILAAHRWPGNVRELENLVERLAVLCAHDVITPDDLPVEYRARAIEHRVQARKEGSVYTATLEAFERTFLLGAIERHGGNRAAAARELGIPSSTLAYRLEKLGVI